MYTLRKTYRFEASHQLKLHDGKCSRLHGHSYIVTFEFKGEKLVQDGAQKNMLIDFGVISKFCKPLVEALDHQHLNFIVEEEMPTAETIAKFLYDAVQEKLYAEQPRREEIRLYAVEVWETATSVVRYEAHD